MLPDMVFMLRVACVLLFVIACELAAVLMACAGMVILSARKK